MLAPASGQTGCLALKASLLLVLLGSQAASDFACILALRTGLVRVASSSWAQGMMPMAWSTALFLLMVLSLCMSNIAVRCS